MAKKKLIYIKDSKDYSAGWITTQKLKNAIKRGEKIKVNDSNKKIINEIKKEVKAAIPKTQTKQQKERESVLKTTGRTGKIRKAEPIVFNQDEINYIRLRVKNKKSQFLPREFHEKILSDYKKQNKLDLPEYLKKISKKLGNVKVYLEDEKGTFHYQTGDFIDRLDFEGDNFKKGAYIEIIDIYGNKKKYTSVTNANKKLTEINREVNRTIKELEKEFDEAQKLEYPGEKDKHLRKKLTIYFTVPQTEISSSEGVNIGLKYDFSRYEVDNVDRKMFDYRLKNPD